MSSKTPLNQKFALDALTSPNPTERQKLIVEIAKRLNKRYPLIVRPDEQAISWMISVMLRWGYATKQEVPNLSEMSYKKLVGTISDVWNMLIVNGE
jgi:hypothetical protein